MSRRVRSLCRNADLVLWCTSALQAWKASERDFWLSLPARVRDKGVLVLTFGDMLRARPGRRSGAGAAAGRGGAALSQDRRAGAAVRSPGACQAAAHDSMQRATRRLRIRRWLAARRVGACAGHSNRVADLRSLQSALDIAAAVGSVHAGERGVLWVGGTSPGTGPAPSREGVTPTGPRTPRICPHKIGLPAHTGRPLRDLRSAASSSPAADRTASLRTPRRTRSCSDGRRCWCRPSAWSRS